MIGDLLSLKWDPYVKRLSGYKFFPLLGNSLPGDLTQFPAVRRLVPNHYVKISGGKAADIVVATIALTEQPRKLIKPTQMKKDSVLVNISRGAVVDEADLVRALDDRLLGAVLDVFEEEPLAENSPLWEMENVIVTPHNSFAGDGERLRNRIKIALNGLEETR